MSQAREGARAPIRQRVQRFGLSERLFHWTTACAFFGLLFSGLVIGRRGSFHDAMYVIHLASAGLLIIGLLLIVLLGDRRALRRTSREMHSLDASDRRWLKTAADHLLAGEPEPEPSGRFNAGQKLNFIFSAVLLIVLTITGVDAIIYGTHHNLIFGGHKIAAFAIAFLVAGHLYMALINRSTRPALSGMLTGKVDLSWARSHYPHWRPETPDED